MRKRRERSDDEVSRRAPAGGSRLFLEGVAVNALTRRQRSSSSQGVDPARGPVAVQALVPGAVAALSGERPA